MPNNLTEFNCPCCDRLCRLQQDGRLTICNYCLNYTETDLFELVPSKSNKKNVEYDRLYYYHFLNHCLIKIIYTANIGYELTIMFDNSSQIFRGEFKFSNLLKDLNFTQNNLSEQLILVLKSMFKLIKMENFK